MPSGHEVSLSKRLQLDPLDHDLARIEQMLMQVLAGRDQFLDEVTSYLAAAGGKRLRPILTLCGAYAGQGGASIEPAPEAAIVAATAVEVLHLGTLYHDDVLDDATLRRGVPSVNAKWDNTVSVIGGDILIARAISLVAGIGPTEASLIAQTLEEVCAGQAAELIFTYDVGRDEAAYNVAIAGKTAALMTASCRFGGLASGLDTVDLERVSNAGHELGMAFQLVDDLLDLEGSTAAIGKPAGLDIVEGVYTLPVIVELQNNARLRELLGAPPSPAQADEARRLVAAGAGPAATAERARDHVCRSQALLEGGQLHPSAVQALHRLGDIVLDPVRSHQPGLRSPAPSSDPVRSASDQVAAR